MNYGIATPSEARAVLRALRDGRKLTQAQVGQRLGLSQKRIARIESSPQRIKVDQLAKLIAVLGGRLVIEYSACLSKGMRSRKRRGVPLWSRPRPAELPNNRTASPEEPAATRNQRLRHAFQKEADGGRRAVGATLHRRMAQGGPTRRWTSSRIRDKGAVFSM